MIRARSCPLCDGTDLESGPARLAAFLWDRLHGPRPFLPAAAHRFLAKVRARLHARVRLPGLALLRCRACDFAFFSYRLDDDEVATLYRDYRGEAYTARRVLLEPAYADHVRELGPRDSAYHRARIQVVRTCFEAWEERPATVLDYGGEPDAWLARTAFPEARVQSWDVSVEGAAPAQGAFDLVLCAHVLEHVSFPVPFLASLRQHVRPGGALYVEVPREYPDAVADLLATRTYLHEHLSHFSLRALERLADRAGYRLERSEQPDIPHDRSLAVLLRRPVEG